MTCAVWMVPLVTFCLLESVGWWPRAGSLHYGAYFSWIDPNWVGLEVVTMAASIAAFRKVRQAIAAWSGLSSYGRGTELGYLGYGLINVMLIFTGVFLRRTVFTVLGYLGVFAYLGHLSWSLFRDSMLLTLVLVPLGIAFIGLEMYMQRLSGYMEQTMARMPGWLQKLRPAAR